MEIVNSDPLSLSQTLKDSNNKLIELAIRCGKLSVALENRLAGRGSDNFSLDQRSRLDEILKYVLIYQESTSNVTK